MAKMARSWVLWMGVMVWAACSSPPATEAPAEDVADTAQADTDAGVDIAKDATQASACPGGEGCACSADADCDNHHCLADETGARACARSCAEATCAAGFGCGTLDGKALCIPKRVNLCEPCLKDDNECAIAGLPGAACVRYGDMGAFCGTPCTGDVDCGTGYACRAMERVEGGQTQQCVKVDAGGALAECTCSQRAVDAQKTTVCGIAGGGHTCHGTRTCGAAGLSACTAATPAAETCDGIDNDCNGATDEGLCDDGNPCTDNVCDGAGGCTHPANNQPCSDGDGCTLNDTCSGGACKGTADSCDDGNPCTDDTCAKLSGCAHQANSAPCEDGSPCTLGDTCAGGVCLPGAATNCDDGDACTADACGDAGCSHAAATGGVCNDGNKCTAGDACAVGLCVGVTFSCDDTNPCTQDSCNPSVGCVFSAAPGSCDDGNACTTADTCSGGVCSGVTADCPVSGPCLTAACSPQAGGCAYALKADGSACSDGSPCTVGDLCAAGDCVGIAANCSDGNPCTEDTCSSTSGCGHTAKNDACDDGNSCTTGDTCATGSCIGVALDCDDGKPCTNDACAGGTCSHTNRSGACDDGKPCTAGDACTLGVCAGQSATDCADSDLCTVDSCDPVTGCKHVASASGPCDLDGDACTPDTCIGGICTAGTAKTCNDGNPCTVDSCDPGTGDCSFPDAADASACDDGKPCTLGEACLSGTCTGGTANACVDSDPCTDDSCDAVSGCQHAARNSGACDLDSSACTADSCVAGLCTAGTATTCDDGNACTTDSCDPVSGACQTQPVADGGACSDGNACTTDGCKSGACVGTLPATSVTTYAGQGAAGASENANPLVATFNTPGGLTLDAAGNLFIADTNNFKVRRVAAGAGAVSTWAGQGVPGYLEGAGTAARFRHVQAVLAVGTDMFVSDSDIQNIRKIDAGQNTSLVAGLAVDAAFPAQKNPGDFVDGPVLDARFATPMGLAYDPTTTTLYVADQGNNRIRAIDLGSGMVSTLTGTGSAGQADGALAVATFNQPTGLWLSADGASLYVTDIGTHTVRLIDLGAGQVSTIAGTGSAGSTDGSNATASFSAPYGITGGDGWLWLTDRDNNRIRAISATMTSTLTGSAAGSFANGSFADATFNQPLAITRASTGLWYVSHSKNNRIRKLLDPNAGCVP